MNDKIFVDTNIWVYAKIEGKDDLKHNQLIENKLRIINPFK